MKGPGLEDVVARDEPAVEHVVVGCDAVRETLATILCVRGRRPFQAEGQRSGAGEAELERSGAREPMVVPEFHIACVVVPIRLRERPQGESIEPVAATDGHRYPRSFPAATPAATDARNSSRPSLTSFSPAFGAAPIAC
jgi:hypothetical protein